MIGSRQPQTCSHTIILVTIIYVVLIVSCPSLTDPNDGAITCLLGDDGNTFFEYVCNIKCNTGYELIGNEIRTCQSDGSWSGSGVMCRRGTHLYVCFYITVDIYFLVNCPSLSIHDNETITCLLGNDGIPSYEDTCSFACNTGYELTGNDTRTCQSDGTWSGNEVMCKRGKLPFPYICLP